MHPASHSGFTLIEVLVALAILACVLMSLPGVLLQAERANAASRRSMVATVAAAEKLEQLRGLAWGFDPDGSRVEDSRSDASRPPVATDGGGGLSLSPAESLDADVPGFVDYLDADGRWVSRSVTGAGPAALVRRWRVARPPGGLADTLVLGVRVLAFPTAGGARPLELARLDTLKSRRAR